MQEEEEEIFSQLVTGEWEVHVIKDYHRHLTFKWHMTHTKAYQSSRKSSHKLFSGL